MKNDFGMNVVESVVLSSPPDTEEFEFNKGKLKPSDHHDKQRK